MRRQERWQWRACLAVGALMAACGQGFPSEDPGTLGKGRAETPLAGGVVDPGHPAVGMVNGCTADLIGDRTVITACHCIAYSGQPVSFCSALSGGNCVSGTAYGGPGCDPNHYDHDFDLAIVLLNQSYRALYGVVPSRISPWAPSKNNALTVVGFGCTDWDGNGSAGYGTKRNGYSQIDAVKNDSRVGRSRAQGQIDPGAGMQAHAGGLDRAFERALFEHSRLSFRLPFRGESVGKASRARSLLC